jgi:hypothetical protein
MFTTYVYDGSPESLAKVSELYPTGTKILCPVCHAELIVALDIAAANKYKVHPGIYCPVNTKHMHHRVELTSTREAFRRLMDNLATSQSVEDADKSN